MQSPVAVCLLHGPEHVHTLVNPAFLSLSNRTDLVGKPIREVWPQLNDQGFFAFLDTIYSSGELVTFQEIPVAWTNPATGQQEQRWLNLIYQPVCNARKRVTGILHIVIDVTDQVVARQAVAAMIRKYRKE